MQLPSAPGLAGLVQGTRDTEMNKALAVPACMEFGGENRR